MDKLKGMGFQAVKAGKSSKYISIDDLGVISFSGGLRRELANKQKENAVIYFNPDEGLLAIHIGTFDRKKNPDMSIISMGRDGEIRARDELLFIEDEHRGYELVPSEGKKNNFDNVEIEKVTEKPDPYSRMVLVTVKRGKVPFRG